MEVHYTSFGCAYIASACASIAIASTQTPVPTNTPTASATSTPTSTPTPTLLPTATEVPPTSTAAPMGEPVSTTDYEVNVITVRSLKSVYDSNRSVWVPNEGYIFAELGIKVVNLDLGTSISVRIGRIIVVEEDGNIRSPTWGFAKRVASGTEVVPKSLTLLSWESFISEPVDFDEVVFLRTVYVVKKHSPTSLLFRFGDSPLIEVVVP